MDYYLSGPAEAINGQLFVRQRLSAKGVKVVGCGEPDLWGTVLSADIRGLPDRAQSLYINRSSLPG